jgi:hypothetical protein
VIAIVVAVTLVTVIAIIFTIDADKLVCLEYSGSGSKFASLKMVELHAYSAREKAE